MSITPPKVGGAIEIVAVLFPFDALIFKRNMKNKKNKKCHCSKCGVELKYEGQSQSLCGKC